MNRSISARFVAAVALAAAALAAAPIAQAHTDVYLSLGPQGRPAYYEQAPVYVRPAPVYAQPRPVYVQPPAYAYERPSRSSYESQFEQEQAWRRADCRQRKWHHRHHDWDRFQSDGRDRD